MAKQEQEAKWIIVPSFDLIFTLSTVTISVSTLKDCPRCKNKHSALTVAFEVCDAHVLSQLYPKLFIAHFIVVQKLTESGSGYHLLVSTVIQLVTKYQFV